MKLKRNKWVILNEKINKALREMIFKKYKIRRGILFNISLIVSVKLSTDFLISAAWTKWLVSRNPIRQTVLNTKPRIMPAENLENR